MIYKACSFIIVVLLLLPCLSTAQEQLSKEEVQSFYSLIRQTKEYKLVMHKVDSVNKASGANAMPEEIKIEIIKKDKNAADFVFSAYMERRQAIGLVIDRYDFQYDQRKKQIVATTHEKSRYSIE